MERSSDPPTVSLFHQCPDFFDVFLPDLNSHQLSIPEDFIKHFQGRIPKKTILKDLSGKVWHVDLEQKGKGLFLTNGWQQFAKDNSLELGDFIVFTYGTSSGFTVRIFGKSGCKKEEASYNENKILSFIKKEVESEPELLPPICTEKYSGNFPPKPKELAGSKEVRPLKPRIASKLVRKHQHVETERVVSPEHLCFSTSIKAYLRHKVHLPKRMLDKYQIKLPEEVVLRNQNGDQLWPVKISRSKDHRTLLSDGWLEFCNDNQVGIHDRLEFQYILVNGRECKEFVVRIKRELGQIKNYHM